MKANRAMIVVLAGLAVSCGSVQPNKNEETQIFSTDSYALFYAPPKKYSDGDLNKSEDALKIRLGELRTRYESEHSKVKEVLIFVHGGMNGQEEGIKGAIDKFNRIAKEDQGIFPIFVTWDSGLVSTYGWHLGRDANGIVDISNKTYADDLRKVHRAPTYFVSDIAGGIGTSPRTFHNAWGKWLQNSDWIYERAPDGFIVRSTYDRTLQDIFNNTWDPHAPAYHAPSKKVPYEFSIGKETESADNIASGTMGTAFFPVTTLLSPMYDGVGRPAWENMQRRAHTLVYRHPTLIDLDNPKAPKADGVVPQILRTIRGWQQKDPNLKVTFAGHSMGTIVLNEAFRAMDDNAGGNSRNCSVRVDKVIYLAGACSLRDFSDTAGRYLEKNKNCQLYAVCLHPKREVGEKLMPYAPLVYSGSLLTWIDQFFQNPRDFPDRTFGSFENCIIAYKYLPQTPRFHLKCFDDNESFFNKLRPESGPQKHGQMGEFRFWDPVFYQPVKNGERPYYSLAPIPALTRAAH